MIAMIAPVSRINNNRTKHRDATIENTIQLRASFNGFLPDTATNGVKLAAVPELQPEGGVTVSGAARREVCASIAKRKWRRVNGMPMISFRRLVRDRSFAIWDGATVTTSRSTSAATTNDSIDARS